MRRTTAQLFCRAVAPPVFWFAVHGGALAVEAAPPQPALPPAKATSAEAQKFCNNIATAAADARFAWQQKKIAELDDELKQRIAELKAKQAEYKEWLGKREEFLKKAEANLVGIYSHMRPDAAAAQLAVMDDASAAAVLAQLNPRAASQILNEIDPARAARLANTMAGGDPQPPEEKQPPEVKTPQ